MFFYQYRDGVHVDDDIHSLECLAYRLLGFIGYLMGLDQGDLIVKFQMQLNESGRPGLTGTQTVDAVNAIYGTAEGHYSRLFFRWQLTIEQRLYRLVADMDGSPQQNAPISTANRPSAQYQPCPASTSASSTPPLSSRSER